MTTPAMLADYIGVDLVDGCLVLDGSPVYASDDGNEIEYDSGEYSTGAAAQEYVDSGSWGENEETSWVAVHCHRKGIDSDGSIVQVDCQTHKIQIDPKEPECTEDGGHIWKEISMRGNGGGLVYLERCTHCQCEKTTDTWAQDSSDGEQGLTSVAYATDRGND